jgi:hypothetical protein
VIRKSVAVGLLVLYCLFHSLLLVTSSWREYKHSLEGPSAAFSTNPHSVSIFENRFVTIKKQLARSGCTRIGYVTDIPEGDSNWLTWFFRTQYALAPILIDDSTEPSLVIANLRDPSSIAHILRDTHLSLLSDYGNGVILLSGKTR